MTSLLLILFGLLGLGGFAALKAWRDRKAGRTDEKLKNAQEILKNAKMVESAKLTATYDDIKRLRKRYNLDQ